MADARPAAGGAAARRTLPWVALGGAAGALASLGAGALIAQAMGPGDPSISGPLGTASATLASVAAVNVLGSFLLGLLRGASGRPGARWDPRLVAALGTGFLGAFTTFGTVAATLALPVMMTAGLAATGDTWWILLAVVVVGLLIAVAVLAALSTAAAALGLRLGGRGAGSGSAGRPDGAAA